MKLYFITLLVAFAFFACKNTPNPTFSNEKLDTLTTRPGRVDAKPALFENAFIKGATEQGKNAPVNFYGVTIGKLKVVSGHLIACDPMLTEEYGIPFTQVFPKGEFPVQLSIANFELGGGVAFARIQFSEALVQRWEFALQKGQTQLPIEGEKKHTYIVDSGIGSFMDEETSKELQKNKDKPLEAVLYQELDKHYHNRWRYTMYNVGQHNLAAFSSGIGDGHYATYIGFDAAGQPCRLLTDFGYFDWRKK